LAADKTRGKSHRKILHNRLRSHTILPRIRSFGRMCRHNILSGSKPLAIPGAVRRDSGDSEDNPGPA
jgi:hypothetical protein